MSLALMLKAMEIQIGEPTQKLILIMLADNAHDNGEVKIDQQHIAERCGLSFKFAGIHLKLLQESGFLTKARKSHMILTIKELKDSSDIVMTQSDKVIQKEIKSKSSPIPYEKIVDLYHEILPQLSSITFLTDKRKTGIRRLYNYNDQHQNLEWWAEYFKLVSKSNFLMGRVDQSGDHANWSCNLDFLININKFVKIVEGEYK